MSKISVDYDLYKENIKAINMVKLEIKWLEGKIFHLELDVLMEELPEGELKKKVDTINHEIYYKQKVLTFLEKNLENIKPKEEITN